MGMHADRNNMEETWKEIWKGLSYLFLKTRDAPQDETMKDLTELKKKIERVRHDNRWVWDMWLYIKAALSDMEKRVISREDIDLQALRYLSYEAEDLLHFHEYLQVANHGEERMSSREMEEFTDDVRKFKERYSEWATVSLPLGNFTARKQSPDANDGDTRDIGSIPLHELDDFVGREEKMEELSRMLQDENDAAEVIAVVGMAGVGKTTLCQHMYQRQLMDNQNPEIKTRFPLMAWVHVGERFDVNTVANDVLGCFTSGMNASYGQLSVVQGKMKDIVQEKGRFLLVLDDVWCRDTEKWKSIRATILKLSKEKGSKILITTRDNKVVQKSEATKTIRLDCLSEEDGWSLFTKHAFPNPGGSNTVSPEEEDLRRCIFQKCGGLPSAIEVAGNLLREVFLRGEVDVEDWKKLLKTDWWDIEDEDDVKRLIKSLCLSYWHLPGYLKPCFRFCSLFGRGEVIPVKMLIELWTANTIYKDDKKKVPVTDTHIDELISRSLLASDTSFSGNGVKLPGLAQDIARYVSGNEFCSDHFLDADDEQSWKNLLNDVRHLSLHGPQEPYDGRSLEDVPIRTLLIHATSEFNEPHVVRCRSLRLLAVENGQIARLNFKLHGFRNLRALRIKGSGMEQIPESLYTLYNLRILVLTSSPITDVSDLIGDLVNLQQLDLSMTNIQRLPKSLSKLKRLQELDLHDCENLVDMPSGMTELTNLSALDVSVTPLEYLPRGLSKLTKLRDLPSFPLGSESSRHAMLRELKNLKLRGKLSVRGLGRSRVQDAEEVALEWRQLQELSLDFSPPGREEEEDSNEVSGRHEKTLEHLKPHRNIKILRIRGYHGKEMPSWMCNGSLDKLSTLELCDFRRCTSLERLHRSPSLTSLRVQNCEEIRSWCQTNGDSIFAGILTFEQ